MNDVGAKVAAAATVREVAMNAVLRGALMVALTLLQLALAQTPATESPTQVICRPTSPFQPLDVPATPG
jgi:hypothetical protein